ncbi:MAG TPA: hypothetical protein VFT29_05135 [Gemmatimonadaceae bacterium]|nr:hypothetical protein [Gemmatimonadaceae bacterium]
MRNVPVTSAGDIAPDLLSTFRRELGNQRTLGDVLAWLRAQDPPRSVTDILTQDEYTHDVVVQWSDRTYLAFDAT